MLYDVIDNLMHIKNAAASDILMKMILAQSHATAPDPCLDSALVNGIAVIYRDGDLPLKQHIRALYAANGEPLAEVVGVPGRIDVPGEKARAIRISQVSISVKNKPPYQPMRRLIFRG